MPKGIEIQLFDIADNPAANLTNIEVAWFDTSAVSEITLVKAKGSTITTDSDGWLRLDLTDTTGLDVGDTGYLVCYKLDNTDSKKSLVFSSKMVVATISSGTAFTIPNDWVRNPAWLALPDVTGLQEFAGLHAVFPDSNFVALSAEGNYTVNWGDGGGNFNVSSGVTAERNIAWANAPATSDVGIADAVYCTFTDSGDTVNLTAHGWSNGQQVAFSIINATTGISTYTTYFIVNKTTDNFQVSTTVGGSAQTLTTDGSGYVYIPKYRQVIVTVVPNGGNITKLNLHVKHSTSLLQTYSSGWLDIAISAQYMTDLRFGVINPGISTIVIRHGLIEQFNIINSSLKNCGFLFYYCDNLRNIINLVLNSAAVVTNTCTFTDTGDLVTWVGHGLNDGDPVFFSNIISTDLLPNYTYTVRDVTTDTFKLCYNVGGSVITFLNNGTGTATSGNSLYSIFKYCLSLTTIPLFNTSNVITLASMFAECWSLTSIPLLDTHSANSFASMFYNCYALNTIPLLDTSNGASFNTTFYFCTSLTAIPLLNTSKGTSFNGMFSAVNKVKDFPTIDTSNGAIFANMFYNCTALESAPPINTSKGTNFSGMFKLCQKLKEVPLIDTHLGTDFSYMFYYCSALESIPLIDTHLGTDFSYMFYYCTSLQYSPKFDTSEGLNFSNMFSVCGALCLVYLYNTSKGTNFDDIFNTCTSLSSIPLLNITNAVNVVNVFNNCPSLKQGRLENTKISFSYANCDLSAAALNDIYTGLATVTSKTIAVSNNWGTASDTPAIATGKGWSVTG